jgi:tetratricopeptide (TPR) repeat protein
VNNSGTSTTTVCHLLIISALGALIYSNTLSASFQFDDKLNIVENLLIRDIGNLWPPTGARWFGLLTFALNYLAGGLNPVGYHLVNICIHILTALSVYLLVLLTFRTPYFSGYRAKTIPDGWFAWACALLFVAHPIQTQAVTYIVQRFASLAALLFVLSLDCYIMARLAAGDSDATTPSGRTRSRLARPLLYGAALVFALLGLRTKENTWTLPAAIAIYDVMFICGLSRLLATVRKQWRSVASLSLLALVIFVSIIDRYDLRALFEKVKATNEISRHDYLVTQLRVIATYLRLLFLPVGQTIDHHYKVYSTVFTPEIIASLVLLALLLASALYAYRLSRDRNPYLRMVAFGIFWFFLTLSVESSLIPISDVMFEHRLYLPSIGVILAVTAAFVSLLEKAALDRSRIRKSAAAVLAVAVIALSSAAYVRNGVWKTELTLWTDAIAKRPLNPRGYNMLGSYYQANFRVYDAIGYFRKALEVDSSYAEARSNLGNAYIQTGRVDEGLNELMITARNNRFDEIDSGILYYNIGKGLLRKGLPDEAIDSLQTALRLIPNEAAVHALLGEAFQRKGLPEESAAYFRKAHELDAARY